MRTQTTTLSTQTGNESGGEGDPNLKDSPSNRILQEYELHLRNTLAQGMDAESFSLHTFEQMFSQSVDNLGKSTAPDRHTADAVG